MNQATIAPSRVRTDLALLRPDMHRPGMVMKLQTGVVTDPSSDPAEVIGRTESELAATALRYRAVATCGLLLFLSPALLAWLAWTLLWRWGSHSAAFQPFIRGYHIPLLSLYEVTSYGVLIVLLTLVLYLSYETVLSMRRMSPDFRFFRDAPPELMSAILDEVSSGCWPRTQALLKRGRDFRPYQDLMSQRAIAA